MEDILRTKGLSLADAQAGGIRALPGLLEGSAICVVTGNRRAAGFNCPVVDRIEPLERLNLIARHDPWGAQGRPEGHPASHNGTRRIRVSLEVGVSVSRKNRKNRNSKPYEFEEDGDPFIIVGIDAEWVYENEGRNRILSYQFAVLDADTGQLTKLIVYTKDGQRISLEHGLSRRSSKRGGDTSSTRCRAGSSSRGTSREPI